MLNYQYGKDNVLIPKDNVLVPYEGFKPDNIQNQYAGQLITVPNTNNPLVTFCCTIELPTGFNLAEGNEKFVYNTECLTPVLNSAQICCQTDCGPVYGTCFTVQITGSIPYIVSLPITSDCGGDVMKDSVNQDCKVSIQSNAGYICCKGNICVNASIGTSTSQPQLPVLNCDTVKLIEFKTIIENDVMSLCDKQIPCRQVKVLGTIELPSAVIENKECPPGSV
ncbi:hypothetical protein [Priestia megaterium]|uniref:hypothetical protein n=1 Tax=Priestia megaterium TaxID=1404 RepID=UPI00301E5E91